MMAHPPAKILLLGHTGQLGQALLSQLSQHFPASRLLTLGRPEVDLIYPTQLAQYLETELKNALADSPPDLIVNAAAYNAVDQAEHDALNAYAINADTLNVLGKFAAQHGCKVVHYSSDYVFDGLSHTPYTEADRPNPINLYGATKLAGEHALQASGCAFLILRTSWLFGAAFGTARQNFLQTVLHLAASKDSVQVVHDQWGCPTSTRFLAQVTIQALQQNLDGLYHASCAGPTNWHAYAQLIVDEAGRLGHSLQLSADRIQAIDQASYAQLTNARAKRPAYSYLSSQKLEAALGITVPNWQDEVRDVMRASARNDKSTHPIHH